ncbi:MAG: TrbM/KikA/MpfK family conjugal transfer protein [Bilophila wadsworthia]|uniref:TrbM/KikA/MpfK family conjugal transfer protein n=2 Tax=Bilophila wadsworthia TaxID=35833 RepID=UPI002430421A|nr:TrbM/KikA/MpfK family conjugal transfer protein [Bilophila wadsworthia]MCI6538602.1 TrbM/KikA/MpfK family conjugal transfer protein [Bilophila wadsworthia]
MKKFILLLALFTLLPMQALAADHELPQIDTSQYELSGDAGLACKAILCLSSGERPGECGPALSRYFGISKKKWKDTVRARRNFLNQCPTVGEDASMPTLVDAIVNGAGRCTAELLNRQLRQREVVRECIPDDVWRKMSWYQKENTPRCRDKYIWVVDDTLPSYCRAYAGHEYTWKVGVTYVGERLNGGHWVDE